MYLSKSYRFIRRGLHQKAFLTNVLKSRKLHGGGSAYAALEQLRDIAVTPEQPELYHDAVKIYNPAYSYEQPAFVAFPKNVEDIKRCLKIADKTNTPVAVKSGGHCFAGYSTTDSDGFVISHLPKKLESSSCAGEHGHCSGWSLLGRRVFCA